MEKDIKKTDVNPKTKTKTKTKAEKDAELLELEIRKVKALEKIGNSIDVLTIWFEEIDKQDWSDRIQFYLAEFYKAFIKNNDDK